MNSHDSSGRSRHRRYPKAQKAALVILADQTSRQAAAEAAGVPRKTLTYWMDRPEFADLRHQARERMADEAMAVARRGWEIIAAKLDEFEPRDLVDLVEMATTKALLMAGEATSRSEHRDLEPDDAGVAALEVILAGVPATLGPALELRGNGSDPDGVH